MTFLIQNKVIHNTENTDNLHSVKFYQFSPVRLTLLFTTDCACGMQQNVTETYRHFKTQSKITEVS